jgi:hypothetical protein
MTDPTPAPVTFELLGGPTVMIRIGGLTLRPDPTFDALATTPLPAARSSKHGAPRKVPTSSARSTSSCSRTTNTPALCALAALRS